MNAVGRATIQLRKKHPDTAWIKLLHPKERVPQNMHTWWAMKEQHENELKTLDTSMTDAKAIKIEENRKKAAEANSTESGGDENATSDGSGAGDDKSGAGGDPQPSDQETSVVEETIDPAVAESQRQRKELEKQKK